MLMMPTLMTMTYIMTMFTIIDGKNFEFEHLQDIDRGGDYDNHDKIDDNGDRHIDLEGPLGSYKEYIR